MSEEEPLWNRCTDCHERPAVLVFLSDGCVAYPDDRFTLLCPQHYFSIYPRGSMETLFWIDPAWQKAFLGTEARDEG